MSWWVVSAIICLAAVIPFVVIVPFLQRWRNATAIDLVWTVTVTVAAVIGVMLLADETLRPFVVGAAMLVWGGRLAWHLAVDRLGRPEDGRYRLLREEIGDGFDRWLWGFGLLQAATVPIFVLPVLLAADTDRSWSWLIDGGGIAIFVIAQLGTALADRQLAWFKHQAHSAGAVCRVGLWGWSRHPNYFFQWLHGAAYACWAWGHPVWWVVMLCIALELLLLLRVTGIPYAERQALRSRGESYRIYQGEVSAFVPWPPRRQGAP